MRLNKAIEICERPERILIIKTNLLGDVLNFLPVANFLRKKFSSARISWLVSRTGYPVVSELADVDEIMLVDDAFFYNYGNLRCVSRWLKEKNFDLILTSYQEECFLIGLLSYLSGAGIRIGYNFRNRGWFFNKLIEGSEAKRRVEVNYELIRLLGGKGENFMYVPQASEKGRAEFEARLQALGLRGDDGFCVLHLFSNKLIKSFRMEYGEELVKGVREELNLIPVIVGSEEETRRWAEERMNMGILNLTGQLKLIELYYLLAKAKLFIGIDSFPLQLTEFSGTKAIALFGPTDVEENLPRFAEPVKADVKCAPCWPGKMECDKGYKCWMELKPEMILKSAKRVLAGTGA